MLAFAVTGAERSFELRFGQTRHAPYPEVPSDRAYDIELIPLGPASRTLSGGVHAREFEAHPKNRQFLAEEKVRS